MFNDRYELTNAVLSRRKTQTRRIIKGDVPLGNWGETMKHSRYQIGEVVAVAQKYSGFMPVDKVLYRSIPEFGGYLKQKASDLKGWSNKMFVCADLMPHRIRITNVRVERLQDISDEDCIAEGIVEACVSNNWGSSAFHWEYNIPYEDNLGRAKLLKGLTPQETYAVLIDRISGNGTWDRNPYVFVYDFELID